MPVANDAFSPTVRVQLILRIAQPARAAAMASRSACLSIAP